MFITSIIWLLLAFFAPKRLPRHELYVICCFVAAVALLFDVIIGASFDLYDYGTSEKIALIDLWQVVMNNTCIGLLFLNFLPAHRMKKIFYMAGWILILLFHEWLWVKLGLMKNKGWSIWYSLLCYPFLFALLIYNLKFYRYLLKKEQAKKATATRL